MNLMNTFLTLISVLCITSIVTAQEPQERLQFLNTVKYEFTQAIYPNSYIFSYERVTTPNQTFCISGGYEEFPDIIGVSSRTNVKDNLSKSGFKAGAEYRFYLKNENKYLAPRGVYIGPYLSYHDFFNKREIEVDVDGIKETTLLKTDFSIFNVDKEEVENEILLKMLDRFPMLDELLTNKEVSSQGRFDSWSYGWRYQFLIGYHFGKKKKH
jgi:hypothetical protein